MIKSIRHKGLKLFWEKGDSSKLPAQHVAKIRLVLTVLDTAPDINRMNIPGGRLHRLTGDMKDFWSLTISRNWRVVFRLENDGYIYDVDYMDYH